MARKIRESEYAALAGLRYRIRQFLRGSDQAAESAGLEPQQYQMLLAIRGLPDPQEASIRRLAERLFLRHHSAVGLIDRLAARGYVRRTPSARDHRQICVILLPRGRHALERVVHERLHELRESGHALIFALTAILKHNQSTRTRRKVSGGPNRREKKRPGLGDRLEHRSAA
ncbi:MAG: MarR family winged helix-turn-helix transcriptional regulator [Candidatus Acidiferrales bacterium]